MQSVAFVVGYVEQSFRLTFYIAAAGLLVASVVCVPDWPWFNRHPLPWQEPAEVEAAGEAEAAGVHSPPSAWHGQGTREVVVEETKVEQRKVKHKKKKGATAAK